MWFSVNVCVGVCVCVSMSMCVCVVSVRKLLGTYVYECMHIGQINGKQMCVDETFYDVCTCLIIAAC